MNEMTRIINGVELQAKGIWIMGRNKVVITFTIIELPDGNELESSILSELLTGQEVLGRKVTGIEMFATQCQQVGRGIGLCLEDKV